MRRLVVWFVVGLAFASLGAATIPVAAWAGGSTELERGLPTVYRDGTWYLRNSQSSGFADTSFAYGDFPGDFPLMCDFTGTGTKTPVVFRAPGVWLYRNSNAGGLADGSFAFGTYGSDIPLCADINGNGTDQPVLFRAGTWFWRNAPTSGIAEHTFEYGDPNDLPVIGDWDGGAIRHAGPGVLRRSNMTWYLRDTATTGIADQSFVFGNLGDWPVVGQWRGGKTADSPGVVRGNTWFLRFTNTPGFADCSFVYGDENDIKMVWHG